MNLFQFLSLLFIAVSLYRVYKQIKTENLHTREMFLWIFAWVFGGVIIFDPNITGILSSRLGIGRGVDLVIYSSIIFLYYISYKIYLKIDGLQKKIKELSTKIALKD